MNDFTDAEQRRVARGKVRKAAEGGSPPSSFGKADLAWAFEGREDELAELEELSLKVRADRLEQEEIRELRRSLGVWTEELLERWKTQEENERRKRARAEVLQGLTPEQRRLLKLDGG
jgi:hypothetical protein